MKNLLKLALIGSVVGLMCVGVKAQTNVVVSWFQTAEQWSTSFNTNFDWSASTLELYSGTVNNNNQNMEAIFGGRVNYKGFAVGPEIHNISALGTITQAGGFIGYGLSHYDLRITPGVNVFYRTDTRHPGAAPFITLEKGMTQNTAMGLRLDLPIDLHRSSSLQPGVSVWATVLAW